MRFSGFGTKKNVARLCSSLNVDHLLLLAMGLGNCAIRIVTYHRVMESFDPVAYPFDEELVDATTDSFRQQMSYLSKNYDVISFDEVTDFLDGKARLPRKPLLITFDDGFRDNYDHAFPLIREYQLPVTMLLATDYIGAQGTFWYDKLAYIIFNTRERRLYVKDTGIDYNLPDSRRDRRNVYRRTLKRISTTDNDTRLAILEDISGNYGEIYDSLPKSVKSLSSTLTWEQVKAMHAAGITFGSHTKSHPFLSRLNAEQLKTELAGSKRKIEEETGGHVSVVAYPNGQRRDFNDLVEAAVKEAGYSIGLSYINGINRLQTMDRYAMKRLHIHPRHDLSVFKMALSLPSLF